MDNNGTMPCVVLLLDNDIAQLLFHATYARPVLVMEDLTKGTKHFSSLTPLVPIHPASRGVAAHTAGIFWSVTGAK